MHKLFLLDAYALIYRAYYAFINNPRINSKGMNTSAVLGFMNTLNEIMAKEQPTHIGVAFDHGKTFRDEAYPAYKAQREQTPEVIRQSVPIIKDIMEAMHIPVLQVDGFEADDVIGTLATKAGKAGVTAYMLTPDKDYAQLVNDNVLIFRPRHGGGYETMGPKEVAERYGLSSPSQMADLLALMGDSADNFPGCPGVGPKTAAKLIAQFNNVENLIANTAMLKGKMREKVEAATEDIRMSKFLATIRTDVPIELDLVQLEVKAADTAKLKEIFSELEFKSLLDKVANKQQKEQKTVNRQLDLFDEITDDGKDDAQFSSFESLETVAHKYKLIETESDARRLFDYFVTKQIISIDTETTSVNAIDAELVGLSFCAEPHEAFYVAIPADRAKAQAMVEIFRPLYEDTQRLKVGQNIKYDMEVLMNYGVRLAPPMFDTMLAHYVLQPEQKHNMDFLAETLLHYSTIHIDTLIGQRGKGQQQSMRDLKPADVCDYAAEDADITMQLYNVLEPRLRENGLLDLFQNIEMPLVPVLADMETTGVRLDTDALAETSKALTTRLADIETEIYDMAGHKFNIASPKQVGEVLFDEMKIAEKPKKTRTGQYVTSEEVLQQLRDKAPVVDAILRHRGLKKLLGTYVDALPKLVNARTGRIHTSFNQAVTATGRLSSSDPNLQNIPVRGEDGKEIRKCFVPEPGCLFFSADYSQIELRVMAHLSGDDNMIEAFRLGHDIHAATAARIYGESVEQVSRDQRTKAKRANFGIIYGITVFGLASRLNISRDEARQLIDGYFASFPKVEAYMEEAKETARRNGYAQTMSGRRRYLPDIMSANATVRGFAERNAINAPIQGTAADIIKMAMIRIHRRFHEEGIRSKMILQVHDELNFSVFPDEKEAVERIVMEEMQNACQLSVPLVADSGWGDNWLEAH